MRGIIRTIALASFVALTSVGIGKYCRGEEIRFTHTPTAWENVSEGIDFSRIYAYDKDQKVDSIAVLKIDDKKNKFLVKHSYEPLTVDNWQKTLNAPVVFNASFFETDMNPTTEIISEGKVAGYNGEKALDIQKEYLKIKGFFLAEPSKKGKSLTDIVDLSKETVNVQDWKEGVTSYPMLVYKDGSIKVKQREGWRANRTAIAKDKEGKLLLFSTEGGYFTLNEFANFLKESKFNIYEALNLDGGLAAGLYVKTPKKEYSNYGWMEKNTLWGDVSHRATRTKLPCVIAVYKR